MRTWGFTASAYNPCIFQHEERRISCLVHGDDFVSVGSRADLAWMKEKLQKRFEVKTELVGGKPEEGDAQEARILNRIIRVTPQGWSTRRTKDT